MKDTFENQLHFIAFGYPDEEARAAGAQEGFVEEVPAVSKHENRRSQSTALTLEIDCTGNSHQLCSDSLQIVSVLSQGESP